MSLTGVHASAAETCPANSRASLLRDHPERLLPCADSSQPADQLWASHAFAALHRFGGAAALLSAVAKKIHSPVVRAAILVSAAYDAARAGNAKEALALLPRARAKRRWLRAEIAAARADIALLTRDWPEAERAAREALANRAPGRDVLRLALARAAAGRHDADTLRKVVRTLEIELPDSPVTRVAETLVPTPLVLGIDELAERWATLISRGNAQAVTDECRAREKDIPDGADGARARFECGIGFATTHEASARAMLESAVEALGSGKAAARALLLLARMAGHAKDPGPVKAICRQIDQTQQDAAECWFLAAFVARQAGMQDEARASFAFVRDRFPRSQRARDAAWFLAFDTYEHNHELAFAAFDALLLGKSYGIDRAQLLYWRGRSRPVTQADQARADWQEALRLDPFGYYGWLAATRLGLDGDVPGDVCSGAAPAPAATPSAAADAMALLRGGFARYASLELEEVAPRRGRQREAWLDFFRQAGQFERVVNVGIALGGQEGPWPTDDDRLPLVQAAFPRAFPDALAAAPAGVDRCLLLSLMRRESRFDADAVSAAQAHGLMQLLVKTASRVASEMGEAPPSAAELHDPGVNVHVAGEYVRRLQLRFGHPLLVAASYNGGPQNVAKWTTENAGLDFDEWVERIPFRETRQYVKAVGAAYAAYALIYGGKRPHLDLDPVKPAPADGIDY